MRYRIGSREFSTKATATQACREILYSYRPGDTVSDLDHVEFLAALLDLHPHAGIKRGPGVATFQVEPNEYGKVCFWLTRVDGTRTDWSFIQCLRPTPPAAERLNAFRSAVVGQILAFKDTVSFPCACPITGEELLVDTCHVDHVVPFKALVELFLAGEGVALLDVKVRPHGDGDSRDELADLVLLSRWQIYHASNAQLRAVSRTANLSVLRRGA